MGIAFEIKRPATKTSLYMYRLFYLNPMGNANQTTTIDKHTQKKKQPKHNTKDGHQTTREQKKEGKKKTYKNKSKTIKEMATGTYISIITLNVYGLNTPTKIQRMAERIQNQDLYICCLQEAQFRPRDT